MSGVVINGDIVKVPGLEVLNWHDDKRLRLRVGYRSGGNGGRKRRTGWIRNIIVHTSRGIPGGDDLREQDIRPGRGPDAGMDVRIARYFARTDRSVGYHIVEDFDGSFGCLADLASEVAYHSSEANEVSIGISMAQGDDAELYEKQISDCVKMIDFLTSYFGIQRQIHWPYKGMPFERLERGGRDCVGVFGHRDQSSGRGKGDPGDAVMKALMDSGYEYMDFSKNEDRHIWEIRQDKLNEAFGAGLSVDGMPGPKTVQALRDAGYADGLWANDPGDGANHSVDEVDFLSELDSLEKSYADRLGGRDRMAELMRGWISGKCML